MSKALCILSLSISALLLVIFILDIAAGIPFGKANSMMDIGFILCSAGLIALSFFCLRDLK